MDLTYIQTTIAYLSPALGFIGTVLVFYFGVPKHVDDGGMNQLVYGADKRKAQQIAVSKKWGNIGLIFIAVGFLLQLINQILTDSYSLS